ncbi:hypothetical protein BBJ28_00010069 [Nothophytophthora sp. Chile5]|nr:hypothetical protein BBJ28_00010069 [Nothophytophthora sp. Chile5]
MLGEAAVGKTTLFRRLMGTALPSDYVPSTTGPRIYVRYFGGAQALVLVFSLSASESWRGLPKYLEVARREILGDEASREPQERQQTLPVVVVGNKSDCLLKQDEDGEAEAKRALMREEARAWCREKGLAQPAKQDPMADDQAARAMAPPNLELKQLGRDAKNLKHKHKSKRPHQARGDGSACSAAKSGELKRSPSAASPGRHHVHGKRSAASSKGSREDALRELLAGKIAEIEVGGDENLESPIALAGAKAKACIYQDEKLPTQTLEAAEAVVADDALTADEKVAALADSLKLAVRSLSRQEAQLMVMECGHWTKRGC